MDSFQSAVLTRWQGDVAAAHEEPKEKQKEEKQKNKLL